MAEETGGGWGYTPPAPHLVALAFVSVWVLILALPMLGGSFIAAPYNDQYIAGYAFREWAATQTRSLGHIPLWNPELYGGLPFVAAMHGDIFYPTAWLRLIFSTAVGMNLGFVVHYVLAGTFMCWFLRTIRVGWGGAITGALAYQLSGVIGSYVSPGHDGKLFVSALLPLALVALVWAIRDRRLEGYALLALSAGLALLSPHPQMVQYFLAAAGIFAMYLATARASSSGVRGIGVALGLALLAVVIGMGISAIQYFPFYAYIPYSPRDEAVIADFAFSTSYAIPWAHVPELFLQRFSGESFNGTYWGPNTVKFHSEYLGLAVVALAVLGAMDRERRRSVVWLLGIAVLFLLIGLGSATPFYRLWWEFVPFVKSTRAPGMALFVVAFVVATLAAFGVDRIERKEGRSHALAWLVAGGMVILMGVLGVISAVAGTLAPISRTAVVSGAVGSIRVGAVFSGIGLLAVGGLAWGLLKGRIPAAAVLLGIAAVVGADLWVNARAFWNYSRAPEEIYASDEIKDYLRSQPLPMRTWVPAVGGFRLYPGSVLMADGIPQWYGHHGNELHTFDMLNGRNGVSLSFRYEGHPALLDLYAINHIAVPSGAIPDSLPGFRRVVTNVPTAVGVPGDLFERIDPYPYARLIPEAVKAPMAQTVETVRDSRFPIGRVVVLDDELPADLPPLSDPLPAPVEADIRFDRWVPGSMQVAITGGAPRDAYLLISENYYKDWRATVDGEETPVLRGNGALLTVPVPQGAREVELRFESTEYVTGRAVSLASIGLVALGLLVPPLVRRRRRA